MIFIFFCYFCLFASYPPQIGKKSDVKYRNLLSWPNHLHEFQTEIIQTFHSFCDKSAVNAVILVLRWGW